MPTVPYVKNTTWADGSGGGTPITAAKLNVVEAGVYEAQLMPAVRAYHNTGQNVLTATFTKLALNSERFDTAGGASAAQHDLVTNNSRLTCLYAGKYMIVGHAAFGANSTGQRLLDIYLNNTTVIGMQEIASAGAAPLTTVNVTTLYDLAVNDYVELRAYQDSGSTLAIASTGNVSPEFMMVRVA